MIMVNKHNLKCSSHMNCYQNSHEYCFIQYNYCKANNILVGTVQLVILLLLEKPYAKNLSADKVVNRKEDITVEFGN